MLLLVHSRICGLTRSLQLRVHELAVAAKPRRFVCLSLPHARRSTCFSRVIVAVHPSLQNRIVHLQVQLCMLVVVTRTTYPAICTADHLAHAPFAAAVRVFATAGEESSAAVLSVPARRKPLQTQCRQLHWFIYVRTLPHPF